MPHSNSRPPAPSDFSDLLAALRAGQPWEQAFRDHWIALTGNQPSIWPHSDGRLNWLWLTDLDAVQRVVEIGGLYGDFASDLTREFPGVTYLGSSAAHGQVVAERFRGHRAIDVVLEDEPSLPPGGADCVVFDAHHGWGRRVPSALRDPRALMHRAFNWLRPGGWLAFTGPNLTSYSALSEAVRGRGPWLKDPQPLRAIAPQMTSAGFTAVHPYLIAPETGAPYMLVPHTAEALRWWTTTAVAEPGVLGILAPRLPRTFFPRILFLARR